jgi:putative peptidoglycan lipid II flippase
MVKKITAFINREVSGVHNAAIIIAGFTLFSQIFGLVRERMLAHFYGASIALDTYYAAFRIPDILFASISTLVSVAVLIPFFSDAESKSGDAPKCLLDQILTLFGIAALVCIASHGPQVVSRF